MTSLFVSLCFISILLFQNSIEQLTTPENLTTEVDLNVTTTVIEVTTTTNWWRRTTPIPKTRPPRPRPPPLPTTTTKPPRIGSGVVISIPILLFLLTIILGFGAIIYAIRTGGNGSAFFTRTNDPHPPVPRDP